MKHRNVVAYSLGLFVTLVAPAGAAWGKSLMPATVVSSSTAARVSPPAVTAPSTQRGMSNAYVPGFDIGSRRRTHSPASTVHSTIPGAPQY